MIGKKLLVLREKSGLSQNEISKRLGIARTTYASYEQGAREPDIEMINRLASFHGVNVGDLLGEKKKESEFTLPESVYDEIIKETEMKYNVNLRDDPFVLDTMKQIIDSYAKSKLKK